MANPQCENGHTNLANELLEAMIRTPLSDYEHRILLFIIRKTYGYKKTVDWISQQQIVESSGIKKSHVCRTIKKLKDKNIIIKEFKMIGIQKDYEQWKLPKQVTNISYLNRELSKNKLPKQVTPVTQTGNKKLPIQGPTKEKKENTTKYTEDSIEIQLSKLLLEKIKINNPKFKEPSLQQWAKYIFMMVKYDKRDIKDIKDVISFCQSDSFWKAIIQSPFKLKEKFDSLYTRMINTPGWKNEIPNIKLTPEEEAQKERLKQFKEGKLIIDDRPIITT